MIDWRAHIRIGLLLVTLTGLSACAWLPTEFLTSQERLNGATTLQAFSPLKETLRRHGMAVSDDKGRQLGLITRYDSQGALLCKASDVIKRGPLHVEDAQGREIPVVLAGVDDVSDVGLLRMEDPQQMPDAGPAFGQASFPAEGSWVSCLRDLESVKVGVVSGQTRPISKARAMLGILLKPTDERPGAVIEEVIKSGAADRAAFKPEDRILAMNAEPIRDYRQLQSAVRSLRPGTHVLLEYERRGKRERKSVALGDETMTEGQDRNLKMSGPVSSRRAGFEEVFQHDCPVTPESMGGPVVNLEGEIVGMNIARSDRVTTFALTPRAVHRAVARIRQHLPD